MSAPKTERPELPKLELKQEDINRADATCAADDEDANDRIGPWESLACRERQLLSEVVLRQQAELACGLACEYHGCEARECTASRYQKLAQDMIAEVQRLRAALAAPPALTHLRAALEAVKNLPKATDSMRERNRVLREVEQAIQRLIDAEEK